MGSSTTLARARLDHADLARREHGAHGLHELRVAGSVPAITATARPSSRPLSTRSTSRARSTPSADPVATSRPLDAPRSAFDASDSVTRIVCWSCVMHCCAGVAASDTTIMGRRRAVGVEAVDGRIAGLGDHPEIEPAAADAAAPVDQVGERLGFGRRPRARRRPVARAWRPSPAGRRNRGSFGVTEVKRFSDGAQKVSGPLNGDSSGGGGECACVGGGVGGVVAAPTRGTTTNPTTNSATKSSAPPRRPIPTIM